MTKVSYNEDDVKILAVLLNSLNVSGLQNMKVICQMADILDRGIVVKERENDEAD